MPTKAELACGAFFTFVAVLIGFWLNDANAQTVATFSPDRMHQVLNGHAITNQHFDEHDVSGHSGWSLDVDVSRGNSTSWVSPRSTGQTSSVLRYTIAFSSDDTPSRACGLSWAETGRTVATAAVWALSNRLIRGDDKYGGQLPGGATLWGQTIPWLATAATHDGLSYAQAAGHIAADVFSEQIVGWSSQLDMGASRELPESHPAFNPGNRWEDQIGMSAHLYRARALSMAMLKERHGEIDGSLIASSAIAGAGYQAGRFLIDENVVHGWGQESLAADLFGARAYHVGELVSGAAYAVGVSRTIQCGG